MYSADAYKAIIFDFGGVVINIDYNRPVQAFMRLGMVDFSSFFSKSTQNTTSDLFETGQMDADSFFKTILPHCTPGTTLELVREAWNSILLDLPLHRLEFLEKLRHCVPIALLSNTNATHIDQINQTVLPAYGASDMSPWFDHLFYSYELGLRKPDEAIFLHALSKLNCKPHEVLFLDDSVQHIEAANRLGIQTHHVKDGEEIAQLITFPAAFPN
ncbi:MAG TPA: HAD family phosphatase [Luteibaculaceae bacterium]|nr:HAD family phosphatase [Luteibaculaceae bacterium]